MLVLVAPDEITGSRLVIRERFWVTIDHPPINLLDLALMREIDRVGRELEADGAVGAVDAAAPW